MAKKISDICVNIVKKVVDERNKQFFNYCFSIEDDNEDLCIVYPRFSNKIDMESAINSMTLKEVREYVTFLEHVLDNTSSTLTHTIKGIIDESITVLNKLVDDKFEIMFNRRIVDCFNDSLALNYDPINKYKIFNYYYDDSKNAELYSAFWYAIYFGLEYTNHSRITQGVLRRLDAWKKKCFGEYSEYCGFIKPNMVSLYSKGTNHMLMTESITRSSYIGFVFRNDIDKLVDLFVNVSRKEIDNANKLRMRSPIKKEKENENESVQR